MALLFNGADAFEWFLKDVVPGGRVLDIGCGGNIKPMLQTPRLRDAGFKVDALDMRSRRATIHCRFEDYACEAERYDGIWASHMLEHMENVGEFLLKCRLICKPGGVFAVTVPPISNNFGRLVPGHLTLWNPGLLCYNLILAGWNLSSARMGTKGKDISIVTRRFDAELPDLASCRGDIEKLARFFPVPVTHGCDANLPDVRWH